MVKIAQDGDAIICTIQNMYLAITKAGRNTMAPIEGITKDTSRAINEAAVKNGILQTTNRFAKGEIIETCPK